MTVWLNDLGIVSALGTGHSQTIDCINDETSVSLSLTNELAFEDKPTYVGLVNSVPLSEAYRINQLLDCAIAQITDTVNALGVLPTRLAVVIGTSTASIHDGERARRVHSKDGNWPESYHYKNQELVAPANYTASALNAQGPCYSISTACSSSAKAMISARALLMADLADVVICGGADSLCQLTVNGFDALSSMSHRICAPFDANRDGINIGEGAALFVMSKQKLADKSVAFLGGGESSDAHHISAPSPSGAGAQMAMQNALLDAKLKPSDIGYINAHGTATVQNDAMESLAINRVFGNNTPVSSSKHLTGHTLGAAGAIEAGICWLALTYDALKTLPFNVGCKDSTLADIALIHEPFKRPLHFCLSNSFAFGGNNVSLILGHKNE